jgi:hypothetical protein
MCPFYLAFVAVIVLIIILLTCTCSDSPDVIYISGFKDKKDKRPTMKEIKAELAKPMTKIKTIFDTLGKKITASPFGDPILSTNPSNDSNTLRHNMIKLSAFDNKDEIAQFADRHHREGFLTQFDTEKLGFQDKHKSGFLTGFDAAKSDNSEGFLTQFDTEKLGFQNRCQSGFLTGFDTAISDVPSGFQNRCQSGFLTGFDAAKSDNSEGFMAGNTNKLISNINFIPNEFANPNSYWNSGIGGSDLVYA